MRTLNLQLRNSSVNLLKAEARKSHPVEACAMLFGYLTDKEAIVRKIVVAKNELYSTTRFEIHPKTVIKAFAEAEKQGLEFIGLFHSHPAPATPSTIDLKFMKLWGNAIWLILSSTNKDIAAYQMRNSKLRRVVLKIE